MFKAWMRLVSAAVALLILAVAVSARAEAPDAAVPPIQTLCDTLIDIMKNAKTLGIKGRYDKLKPVIMQSFDLPDMTRLAVGPSWATMPAADREALLSAFERYTIANYAHDFDGYDGEKFVVAPTVTARGADRVVDTKLVTKDETYTIAYRMRQVGGAWKVIDVYYKSAISQLATRRSDYSATLASGGAPALIKKINALTEQLMKG